MLSRFSTVLFVFPAILAAQTTLQVTSPLGIKYYSIADDKATVAAARKALASEPKNADLMLKLSLTQANVRQYREAVATCTRALAIAPDNADLLLERGHRELGLREFTKARADLERAQKIDPKKVDVYYHLGLSHYFLGEFAESADAFHHAVDLAPNLDNRINSSNWLYSSLRRAGKADEAAKALATITPEMKNTEPHTFFYLSMLRFYQGRVPEAKTIPAEPAAGNTDVEAELQFDTVSYGVGNWYLYNGKSDRARQYFEKIVKGQQWMTWGFVGAETDLTHTLKSH